MSVSIPSYKTDDPNYRYKMPRLIAKVEGRGNGIRTNITNMGDIARCLKRQPDYPTKFCGIELGTSSKFDPAEGKAIVNGSHQQDALQEIIDKFIDKFVLCENCHLPEIDLMLKRERVQYQCNACGQKGEVDNAHKLATYILKNPPAGADSTMGAKSGGKKTAAERREEKLKSRKVATNAEEDEEETEKKSKKKSKEPKDSSEEAEKKAKKKSKEPKDSGDEAEKKSKKKSKETKDSSEEAEKKSKKSKSKEGKGSRKSKETDEPESKTSGCADDVTTAEETQKKSKKHSKKSSKSTDDGGSNEVEVESLVYDSPEIQDVIQRLICFISGVTELPAAGEKLEISSSVTPTLFSDQLRLLQRSQDFDNSMKFFVAMEVLFSECFRGLTASSLDQRIKYIKPAAHKASGKDILTALQDFVYRRAGSETVPEGFKAYAAILYKLYDNDILAGDDIVEFYSETQDSVKEPQAEQFLMAKAAAEQILAWLADSDDEEDSDDETPVPGRPVAAASIRGTAEPVTGAAKLSTADAEESDVDVDEI